MRAAKFKKLFKAIAYDFADQALIEQALTHRSAAKNHNERLEFLGDAVLGMVIAEALFEKFPKQPEGKLTRMRASLVNKDALAKIGKRLELGELVVLGSGEMKSGGHRRESILADCVEAILGAIYLDSGFDDARATIYKLYGEQLAQLDPDVQIKDSKTQLQEYLQSRKNPLPEYEVINISGKDHAQTFDVECRLETLGFTTNGRGRSRRIAEQKAAKAALEQLQNGK